MCNKEVKFGSFLKKALSMGADFVAKGHYANNVFVQSLPVWQAGLGTSLHETTPSQKHHLLRGVDPSKDQSYFLWTLTQSQLSKILFPIGHLKKTEVRKLAKKFNLPVAEKKDSQGICFLGDIDIKDFLKHYIKEKKGEIIVIPSNGEGKKIIGYHSGAVFHTLGERHGFTITKKNPNDGPYYVVARDIKKNTLIVSQSREGLSSAGGLSFTDLRIEDANWISVMPAADKKYTAQVRYHGELLSCKIRVEDQKRSRRAEVVFEKPILAASGQSMVIYDG